MVELNYDLKKERDEKWKFRVKIDLKFDESEKYMHLELRDDEDATRMLVSRRIDEKNETIWSPPFFNTYNNQWSLTIITKDDDKNEVSKKSLELELDRPAKTMTKAEEQDMIEEAQQSKDQEVEEFNEPTENEE